MKPSKVSLNRLRSNKKYPLRRWKVVYWREGDGEFVRQAFGKRIAADAWRLWWHLYYTPHAREVELWRGNVRLMHTTAERWRD